MIHFLNVIFHNKIAFITRIVVMDGTRRRPYNILRFRSEPQKPNSILDGKLSKQANYVSNQIRVYRILFLVGTYYNRPWFRLRIEFPRPGPGMGNGPWFTRFIIFLGLAGCMWRVFDSPKKSTGGAPWTSGFQSICTLKTPSRIYICNNK